jgi:hypothetical protein
MSEVLIFAFGSVLFVITSSATFAFALTRFHEVQMDDMADSGRYPVLRDDGLTELYVSPTDLERLETTVPSDRASDGVG